MKYFQHRASLGSRQQKLRRRVIVCGTLVVMLWIGRCACPLAVKAARDFLTGGCIDRAIYAFYDCLLEDGSIAEAAGAFGAYFNGNAS